MNEDDRVRIKYDYTGNVGTVLDTGNVGTVLDTDVLGVTVQWNGSSVEDWYYYEELELVEYA